MMRHEPTDEDTSQETDYRQEYLPRDEVKPIEERPAEKLKTINGSHRQGAESSDNRGRDSDHQCRFFTTHPHLLMDKRRTYLME
jgi:hypothetical protein